MLKENLPSNVACVVRPLKIKTDNTPHRSDPSGDRRIGRRNHAVRHDTLVEALRPVEPPVREDNPASWWSAALLCVMEGFALYGAALHPNAAFPVEVIRRTASARSLHPAAGSRTDLQTRRRWSCWAALGETTAVLWKHWRREREINRAVAALSSYDDRTLRDLGINGRADIERVVRYCRDC